MVTRRKFLKYTGATTLTLFSYTKLGGLPQAIAQIPGGSLDPLSVPKYKTPMLIPPVMPRAGIVTLRHGQNADYYEFSMREKLHLILPA